MTLKIHPIPAYQDNYMWIIHDDTHAVVVDPGQAAPVDDYLAEHQLTLTHILITHHHWDHVNGLALLQADWNCEVFAPIDTRIPGKLTTVKANQRIEIPQLKLSFEVIETPGHTLSHICYFNDQWLFCGDTLFSMGCGKMFEGNPAQYVKSLHQFKHLPATIQMCCGHEYTLSNINFALSIEPDNESIKLLKKQVQAKRNQNLPSLPTSLQQELQLNPFLRTDETTIKQALSKRLDIKIEDQVSCFAYLRQCKDEF